MQPTTLHPFLAKENFGAPMVCRRGRTNLQVVLEQVGQLRLSERHARLGLLLAQIRTRGKEERAAVNA